MSETFLPAFSINLIHLSYKCSAVDVNSENAITANDQSLRRELQRVNRREPSMTNYRKIYHFYPLHLSFSLERHMSFRLNLKLINWNTLSQYCSLLDSMTWCDVIWNLNVAKMMQEWLIYGGSMKGCIVLRKHKKFKSAVGPSSIHSSKLGAEQEGECWDTMVSSHCTLRTQTPGQPIKSWGWINEEMQSPRTMYSIYHITVQLRDAYNGETQLFLIPLPEKCISNRIIL